MKKFLALLVIACASLAAAQCPTGSLNISRTLSGVNIQTGSANPYVVAASDANKLLYLNSPSALGVTLAAGTTANFACQMFEVRNAGSGTATITCSGCTINNAATLALGQNQGVTLWNDGLNYWGNIYGTGGTLLYPNSSNGTTCNELAKIDPTAGAGTFGKATTTAGGEAPPNLLGVVHGCGTSGNASIVTNGYTQVMFDSATVTVGDAIGVSSTPGLVTDLGSPNPTSGTPIGQVALSPSGQVPSGCTVAPGCYVNFQMGSGGSGGGGNANALVNNPALTATNSVTPTASSAQPMTLNCPSGASSSLPCLQVLDNAGNVVLTVLQNGQVKLGNSSNAKSIGSGVSSNTDFNGELTASASSASYSFTGTYTTHPTCVGIDVTSRSAVQVTYTGVASVTFTTSGATDVVDYVCIARN